MNNSPVPPIPPAVPPVPPVGRAPVSPRRAPDDLKNRLGLTTVPMVVAALLSGGIFAQMWLYRSNDLLAEATGTPLLSPYYLMGGAAGLWVYLIGFQSHKDAVLMLALLGLVASAVVNVVWAFRARTALEAYALRELRVPLQMNSFYTFALNVYYVSYCINDLPNVVHKAQLASRLMAGQPAPAETPPGG